MTIQTSVASIEIDQLTKSYGGTRAVDGVSFASGRGVVGLLGPNGAGKTTLLRMVATVLAPDSGTCACWAWTPPTPANGSRSGAGSATCRSHPACTRASRPSTSSTTSRCSRSTPTATGVATRPAGCSSPSGSPTSCTRRSVACPVA